MSLGSSNIPSPSLPLDPKPEPVPAKLGSAPARKRILLIDDNIVFLKAMSMKLGAMGYEVLTAVDGGAAVRQVRTARPDLILLDLNFPPDVGHGGGVGWDGLLILAWLRRMHEAQDIPVVAVTAGDLDRYEERCRAAGVTEIFLKPIDHGELAAAIRRILHEPEPEHKPRLVVGPARRILFVDDESDWRYMATLYLTECGYEVTTTEDAANALTQAATLKPDMVILDLNLGGESALTLMKLLTVAHPDVPILIYTGMQLDEGEVADLIDQGAFECLRKGTMEELLTAVGTGMAAAPQRSEAEVEEGASEPPQAEAAPKVESVLLVEDDVQFGDTLRTFLESYSFCVTRVTDGAEALRQIAAVDFDLILCDVVLPSLSGDELYAAVEQMKPHLCKRFLFMTGHQAEPRTDGFIRRVRGMMLWKPFNLPDVLKAAETIRRRNATKPVVGAPIPLSDH